ncbi:unnamed protein product [Sphenostylis stenocarpa]|uniref:Uncharacterized protein n=1 Tax=Sphenostylis stenocarpa TaxID=92480 RepID=A0AA86W1T3_9FABA|nr:unnamed protein product [Sphenostylis stenocarpa]
MFSFVASSSQLQRIRKVGQAMGPTKGIVLEQLSVITNEPPTLVHRQSWCSPSMAQIAPTLLLRDQRCNSPISNVYTLHSFYCAALHCLGLGMENIHWVGGIALAKGRGDHSVLFSHHTGRGAEGHSTKDSWDRGQFLVIRCKYFTPK